MPRLIDINCDMGEGLGSWTVGDAGDEQLMALISSANVATGFHAGDPNLMDRTVRLAGEHGVGVGAHPGFRDLHGFGRRFISAGADELVNDVLYQLGALREFTRRNALQLQHIKPHGALYMHAARDEAFSHALVDALRVVAPELYLYCMDVSVTYGIAAKAAQPVAREFYADRDYDRSGSIVFTRRVGALDPQRVADKVVRACLDGKVATVEGDSIDIAFDSVCFHSDTPGALGIATAIRQGLAVAGIGVASIGSVILNRDREA